MSCRFDIWRELEFVGSARELPNSGENVRVHIKVVLFSMVLLEAAPW